MRKHTYTILQFVFYKRTAGIFTLFRKCPVCQRTCISIPYWKTTTVILIKVQPRITVLVQKLGC